MRTIKRTYLQDPGHGWVVVPFEDLAYLRIADKITSCSYKNYTSRKNCEPHNAVYLEEDCDLTTYLHALSEKGIKVEFNIKRTNKSSRVRSYERYTCPKCWNAYADYSSYQIKRGVF